MNTTYKPATWPDTTTAHAAAVAAIKGICEQTREGNDWPDSADYDLDDDAAEGEQA